MTELADDQDDQDENLTTCAGTIENWPTLV
jgi:hypothetical protein